MKKLLFSLMAIIAIGFSSCSKKEEVLVVTAQAKPTFPVQLVLGMGEEGEEETTKDLAAPCAPKSLLPTFFLDTMYSTPPEGPAGVYRLIIKGRYINPNPAPNSVIVKFQFRNNSNTLVVVGPFGLQYTPFGVQGEFNVDDASISGERYPLTFIRAGSSIIGCPRTSFFYPPTPIIVQP